jgi:hypothetical protein
MSVIMLWLMGNKSKWGPVLGITNQFFWFYYIIVTKQWGLFLGAIAFLIINTRNTILWFKQDKLEKGKHKWKQSKKLKKNS